MREATFGVPNSSVHKLENKNGCKSLREGSGLMRFEALLERLKTKQQDPKTQWTFEKKKKVFFWKRDVKKNVRSKKVFFEFCKVFVMHPRIHASKCVQIYENKYMCKERIATILRLKNENERMFFVFFKEIFCWIKCIDWCGTLFERFVNPLEWSRSILLFWRWKKY